MYQREVYTTAEAAHLTEREVDVLRLMGNGDSNIGKIGGVNSLLSFIHVGSLCFEFLRVLQLVY